MHIGNALIRAYLHIDPDMFGDAEWGYHVRMALWFENRQTLTIKKAVEASGI